MNAEQVLKKYFGKLRDLPCWGTNIDTQYAWIWLNFGDPWLRHIIFPHATSPRLRRRTVRVKGKSVVHVNMCNWELFDEGKRICHSQSKPLLMHRKVHVLDGQCLKRIGIQMKPLAFGLHFEYGTVLVLHRNPRAKADWEFFHLYQGRNYLSLQSDGNLRHGPIKLNDKMPKVRVTDLDLDI